MRALALLLASVGLASGALGALGPGRAEAAPTADLVIVWAPGAKVTPVESAARDAGAAVIDRSPRPRPKLETSATIRRGIAAYDALQLAEAATLLGEAKAEVDRTGAAEVTQTELSDLFLYRALLATQQGDPTAAWDELIIAVTVAPSRVLDPARFPPRVGADLERVRAALEARAKATLVVDAPPGCAVSIDGAPVSAPVPRLVGAHWASVICTAYAPWGTRLELTSDATVVARNTPMAPPTSDDLLIQARTAGARAFVAIEVSAGLATARLVGADGRERDRRTVTLGAGGDLSPLAAPLRAMLAPPRSRPWYASRWAWAAGAAVLAAAIVIPITAAAARDTTPTTFGTKLDGIPTW